MTGTSSDVSGPILAPLPTINSIFILYRRTMQPIKRNSLVHLALQYLRMKRGWVTRENLFALSPTKYKKVSRAEESLNKLVCMGFAEKQNSCYIITDDGINFLPLIVKNQKYIVSGE